MKQNEREFKTFLFVSFPFSYTLSRSLSPSLNRNVIRQSYLINFLVIRSAVCHTRYAEWEPAGLLRKLFSVGQSEIFCNSL